MLAEQLATHSPAVPAKAGTHNPQAAALPVIASEAKQSRLPRALWIASSLRSSQ